MFESVTITSRLEPKTRIHVGDLAESLLYYGSVNFVGNGGLIAAFAGAVGTLQTLELIERGHLRIQFEEQMLGIQTHTTANGESVHGIVKFGAAEKAPEDLIQVALERAGWEKYQAKIAAKRFAKRIERFEYPDYDGRLAKEALLANDVACMVIPAYFEQINAQDAIPSDLRFEVSESEGGLHVSTNIDFRRATDAYRHTYRLSREEVTPALLLDVLRKLYDQQYISATLKSEVLATPLLMAADSGRLAQIIRQATKSKTDIRLFEDLVFEGAGSVGQVMTSGKRSFDEFLRLLDKAQKFRHWVAGQSPDADLLSEYHRRIAEKTFLEKLPAKMVRFALFTGGGLLADHFLGGQAGTSIGVGLSAADSFLLEKLGLGWKPHHFVTGELREFVKGEPR